jgi:phosphoglucomutase
MAAGGPIRFGTSGWRGVLGEEFTFERARAVVRAVAEKVCETAPPARRRVVVAHDTRFLGERLARMACGVLRAAGVRPVAARGPTPTPVASFAVRTRRAAAGLIFTASHNPPEYQGIKIVAPWGAAAPEPFTRDVERRAARILAAGPPLEAGAGAAPANLVGPYRRRVLEEIDLDVLRRSRLRVVYDALHGAGAGVLDAMLAEAGVTVTLQRGDPDPRFGGGAPDPVASRLLDLVRAMRRAPVRALGLATDGDADRFAVVDAGGRLLTESEGLALLVDHLVRTGRVRRGLAISIATGSLVERMARAHGLAVERHPIGFKHLTAAMREGRADVAGEESGGFAWAPLALDKDGILAGCLLAELAASLGTPLRMQLRRLQRRFGTSACGRIALPRAEHAPDWQARLRAALPRRLDGVRVTEVSERDGLHAQLEDGFLLVRASGTEPVVRVYAEAPSASALARRLRAGVRWLRRARAGR